MKYGAVICSFMFLFSCKTPSGTKNTAMPATPPATSDPARFQRYTGSLYQDNYVWGGAMNLCWTELCESVLKGPLEVQTDDAAALRLADQFNRPVCSKADLDAASYYVKAGFGPRTLQAINRECRDKFPEKSFGDLNYDLGESDIISYAYFFKTVAYEKPFTRKTMLFAGQRVAGFEAAKDQKHTVEVLHYQSDDQFVIRLRLQDPADELVLAKGYDTRHPAAVLQALTELPAHAAQPLADGDFFKMPLLKLSCRRDYTEMLGKALKNNNFTQYFIAQMFENIAFELDETGARVENEAVIGVERTAAVRPRPLRYFYLDKPFWVIMKRADTPNPYFLLGVNHPNIMQPE